MQSRVQFAARFALCVLVTTIVVSMFGTTRLKTSSPSAAMPLSLLVARLGIGTLPATALNQFEFSPTAFKTSLPGNARDAAVLKAVFAAEFEHADLLRTWEIPLSIQGADTVTNVQLAASAVDYTALRPNEVFSFNRVVGIRTEERGYRPGLMYSNGEVVTGIGGGICIVSTGLYNAVLESGLKIIERHPHSGPVSYAAPGRDAAVSYGWADMCFKNNTGSALFVRAGLQDDRLVIAFYGNRKPGQSVEVLSEDYEEYPYKIVEEVDPTVPEGQVVVKQKARKGFSVTTVRVIRQDGKVVSREVVSRDMVLPRNKIVLVREKSDEGLPVGMPDIEPLTMEPLALPAMPSLESEPVMTPQSQADKVETPMPAPGPRNVDGPDQATETGTP